MSLLNPIGHRTGSHAPSRPSLVRRFDPVSVAQEFHNDLADDQVARAARPLAVSVPVVSACSAQAGQTGPAAAADDSDYSMPMPAAIMFTVLAVAFGAVHGLGWDWASVL